MKRTGRGLAAAAAALGLIAWSQAGTSAASASQEKVLAETSRLRVVESGDVVRHDFKTALPNARNKKLTGKRSVNPDGGAGCSYAGSDELAAEDAVRGQVTVSREVSSNLKTCELILETATLSEKVARENGIRIDDEKGETVSSSNGSATLTTNASTIGVYQKQYYEDPPQIDVTSVTARVRWTYTGTCTTASWHEANWGWYVPSGWSRTANWWGSDPASCAYGATTSNTATYRNGSFCGTVDTWNSYDPNYVQGKSNGSSYYEYAAQKWGGCTNLLSYHRVTGSWS